MFRAVTQNFDGHPGVGQSIECFSFLIYIAACPTHSQGRPIKSIVLKNHDKKSPRARDGFGRARN
jgi:hypothetical protein